MKGYFARIVAEELIDKGDLKDMWRKIVIFLLLSVILTACHFVEEVPKLNYNNETGWTVLHGIYAKTKLGHDVLIYEQESGEEMYIFMTFAEECDVPSNLKTGNKIAIKIVLLQEISGIDTTEVFEWEQYDDSLVSVDPDILSKLEKLSQHFSSISE